MSEKIPVNPPDAAEKVGRLDDEAGYPHTTVTHKRATDKAGTQWRRFQ